jgi:hypothetical protein
LLVGLYLLVHRGRGHRQAGLGAAGQTRIYNRRLQCHRSLLVLLVLCAAVSVAWSQVHESIINRVERQTSPAGDEVVAMSICRLDPGLDAGPAQLPCSVGLVGRSQPTGHVVC